MSHRFRKLTPFSQQSRRRQRAAYIELKNNIRRASAILGGAFHTHDFLHGLNGMLSKSTLFLFLPCVASRKPVTRNELRPLYKDLRHNRIAPTLCLEQERIGFA